jgi:hypothetical protein
MSIQLNGANANSPYLRCVAVTGRSPAGDLPRLAPNLRYDVESTLRTV